jgi:hypothetical protein
MEPEGRLSFDVSSANEDHEQDMEEELLEWEQYDYEGSDIVSEVDGSVQGEGSDSEMPYEQSSDEECVAERSWAGESEGDGAVLSDCADSDMLDQQSSDQEGVVEGSVDGEIELPRPLKD